MPEKFFSFMFLVERNTAFVLQGSPSGRLSRFARNDIKCVARKRIKKVRKFCNKFPSNKLLYSVRSTMSLRGAKRRGNLPEGIPVINPRKILLYLRGEKGAHKQKSEHYLPDNAISKAKCAPRGKTIPPQLRWYCLLMCFRIKELWIVICVNFGARGDFRPVCRSTARRLPLSFRSPKSLQEGFRPHTDYTCRWLRVRASTGLSPAPVF